MTDEEKIECVVTALEMIYSYAYGASGVTGDNAGHLTQIGMMAKSALEEIGALEEK